MGSDAASAGALPRAIPGEQPAAAPGAAIDWSDPASYDERLLDEFLGPLRQVAARDGTVPVDVQRAVLNRLHWYFTIDARPMAPTMVVNDERAAVFHQRVADVMEYIDADTLTALSDEASAEVRHALYSYKAVASHSGVAIDAVDLAQRLVRLTYWVHGPRPAEKFLVDGAEVRPAFGKYRGCVYFRRVLMRQRIAWLPVRPESVTLRVVLDGVDVSIAVGPQPFALPSSTIPTPDASNTVLREAARRYCHRWALPGASPGPTALARLKATIVKVLAKAPHVRARFRDAWVFCDRAHDADDNAEHLYRWVRRHHPEINAWFLLNPGTPDWQRLEREGFRLMAPGLFRKLLLLNSRHVISSHPENDTGGFDRRAYGDAMHWRFTDLKHGIIYNDLSHYYAGRQIDCVIAPSPAEFHDLVRDDSPYQLTKREVKFCNAPRHDRLLQRAVAIGFESRDEIMVMPTWRARLIDDHLDFAEKLRRVRDSDYGRSWRSLLHDRRLHALAERQGKRIVLVPHSNLRPYLNAFELPPGIVVASPADSIQDHLARCSAFITDYTSVAFDVALLRRGIFYFQFDRDAFYGGGHNWRPGYFDFERDGFGPVARSADVLIERLDAFFANNAMPDEEFLRRMAAAMPVTEATGCQNAFALIRDIGLVAGAPDSPL